MRFLPTDRPSQPRSSSSRPSSGRPDSGRPSSGRPSSGRPSSRRPKDTREVPAPPKLRDRPAPREPGEGFVVPEPEIWIDEGQVHSGSSSGSAQKRRSNPSNNSGNSGSSSTTSITVHAPQLVELVGAKRAARLEGRLGEAADAFASERFGQARQILGPIAKEVPDLPEVRELHGLTLYRLGKFKEAARELDAFVALSNGSTEQHPVLADCRRALKQYKEVDRLWEELRESSPSGALVSEGRIVAAGALADQQELSSAVRLLAKGFRFPKRPMEHHLRRAYALADLYERSGDVPQARVLFGRIARADPSFLDASDRAAGLG